MFITTILVFLASIPPSTAPSLPEGHRPFGPPSRDQIIPGWETFVDDMPTGGRCESLAQPMIRPLNPPARAEAVKMLSKVSSQRLSDNEAAKLLGIAAPKGKRLATSLFAEFLGEMRRRQHRAVVEHRDSWSVADQQDYDQLIAQFRRGQHRDYRPYLVRAASKFGDGHGGPPVMYGSVCGGDLRLLAGVVSYSIPPSVHVPTIVFLPREPSRVFAYVLVAR